MQGISEAEIATVDGTPLGRASVKDLSRSGLRLAYVTSDAFSAIAGLDTVVFAFSLPTGRVSGRARIVWANRQDAEIGLAIEDLDGVSLDELLSSILCGVE